MPRLCPTLCLFGDSAELTTAAALWGVPHAPGYPLLTLLGHGFTKLPWGEVPFRVHLMSALFHAATVAVVGRTLFRITESRLASLSGAALLAFSHSFLLGSLYYEVFPLNDWLFAVCLAWVGEADDTRRRLLPWVFGLALAHQQMIVLALPALVVLSPGLVTSLRERPRLAVRPLCAAAAAFGLSYAILLVAASRNPALNWGDVHDLRALLRLLLRVDYGGFWSASSRPSPWLWGERQFALLGTLQRSLGWPALIACIVAIGPLSRWRPRWTLALALGCVTTGPLFFAINRVGLEREEQLAFVERFSTMCHVPLALLFGFGVAWLRERLAVFRMGWLAAAVAAAVLAPTLLAARTIDLSKDDRGRRYVRDLVESAPDGALVMLAGDMAWTSAQYACTVEQTCGNRKLLAAARLFDWYVAQLRREQPELVLPDAPRLGVKHTPWIAAEAIRQRPVYAHPVLLTKAPQLARQFRVVPELLLVQLLTVEPDRGAALLRCRAMAEGRLCAGCQGFPTELPRPTTYAQVAADYRAALLNHADLHAAWGGAEEVTRRLREMADTLALPVWTDPALPLTH